MRVSVKLGEVKVMALIDAGAARSIIAEGLRDRCTRPTRSKRVPQAFAGEMRIIPQTSFHASGSRRAAVQKL